MIDSLIGAAQPFLEARIEFPKIVPQAREMPPLSRCELFCELRRTPSYFSQMVFQPMPARRVNARARVSVMNQVLTGAVSA
jgi:hypothetical protein